MKITELSNIIGTAQTPLHFSVVGIGEIQTKQSKNGKEYQTQTILLQLGNQTINFDMFESKVSSLKVGDTLKGFINEQGYPDFIKIDTSDVSVMSTPQPSNYQQVKAEKQATQTIVQNSRENVIRDRKLGLAGLLQSYRAGGDFSEEARKKAIADAKWIRQTSEDDTVWLDEALPF